MGLEEIQEQLDEQRCNSVPMWAEKWHSTKPSGLFSGLQELLYCNMYCKNVDLMFAIIYCPLYRSKIKAGVLWRSTSVFMGNFWANTGSLHKHNWGSKTCHSKSPLSTLNYILQWDSNTRKFILQGHIQ